MLELITLINNIEDSELRKTMIIQTIKINKSNVEMESLFKQIKRTLNR